MEEGWCPNYNSCRLVQHQGFPVEKNQLDSYMIAYCKAGQMKWEVCKRYVVKKVLNFCPDFVLPDTLLSPDEIIDKFDNEQSD
jgi:hypothetical protein